MQRTVPPWLGVGQRAFAISVLAAVPVWIAFGLVAYAITDRAPVLHGRVDSISETRDRRGTMLLRIQYSYEDEGGESHEAFRDLVPHAAQDAGLTTVGAPLSVKLVFGEPLIQGAPNVFVVFPFAVGGIFLVLAVILGAVHRNQMGKIALALRGELVRGVISSLSVLSIRGTETWTVRYEYSTPLGLKKGSVMLPASQLEGPLAAYGIERMPQSGDPIWVAFDRKSPQRSAAYSLESSLDAGDTGTATNLALPSELMAPAPRALLPDAPSVTTELPTLALVLLIGVLLLFGVGPVLNVFVASSPGDAMEMLFVGEMIFFALLTFFFGFYWDAVRTRRKVLQFGEPVAALITKVDARSARVWISFETSMAQGGARGRESIRSARLNKMLSKPVVGGRVFLVESNDAPGSRVIWGFGG